MKLLLYVALGSLLQCECEGAAYAELAANRYALAVSLDNVLNDSQAQACASLLARTTSVGAVEALEDTLCVLLGNAQAVVLDLDKDLVQQVAEADYGRAILLAVANRVDHKVDQHLADKVLVGNYAERRGDIVSTTNGEFDILLCSLHLALVANLFSQGNDIELLVIHAVHIALQARNSV